MSTTQTTIDDSPDIPEGYERIDGHDHLSLVNEEKGIVITTHKRDRIHQDLHDVYPFRVLGAQNQVSFYDGSFQSLSHAEEKVIELSRRH